jgi:hypothetical protein
MIVSRTSDGSSRIWLVEGIVYQGAAHAAHGPAPQRICQRRVLPEIAASFK